MSWKGFTKAVARIPARLTKGVGATSGIKDEEFEQLEEQFKLLDSVARKLSSDTKSFKDSLSLMLSQQSSLAEVFVQLYEPLVSLFN
jgi:amphiphysin